jgi:uncharacterized protein Yka (UPF0111/DUF47 family)
MFGRDAEIQAKGSALALLRDEVRGVLDASKELSALYSALTKKDNIRILACIEKIRQSEENAELAREVLGRQLTETGITGFNRSNFLRTAYRVEALSGYVSGVAFRLSQVKLSSTTKKQNVFDDLRDLIDMSVESVQRLNEVLRALLLNPSHAIDLSNSVQELEKKVNDRHRALTIRVLNEVENTKNLLLLKDVVQEIADLVDNCLFATDSLAVLALGL